MRQVVGHDLEPLGGHTGWDVADAVATSNFEEVAGWLWHGVRDKESFAAPKEMLDVAGRVAKATYDLDVMDQVRAVVSAIHSTDPFRDDPEDPQAK